jgi:hypothetical protein
MTGRPSKYKTEEERLAARRLAGRLRNQRYRQRHPIVPRPSTALDLADDEIDFKTTYPVKSVVDDDEIILEAL